ncbi:hypothetical protein D3C80_1270260 [compost metagenome]
MPRLRHIQQHHFSAVARQGFGDGRADTACRTGHQGATAAKRAGPILDLAGAGFKAQDLARNERALGREEKTQGTFQLVFGTFSEIQQLRGRTVAQLFGQRAAETFECTLRDTGQWVVEALRGAAENHHVGARRQAAQQWLEEFAQLLQFVAVGQMSGIEHHGL